MVSFRLINFFVISHFPSAHKASCQQQLMAIMVSPLN